MILHLPRGDMEHITDRDVRLAAKDFLTAVGRWPPTGDEWIIACASWRLNCNRCGCTPELHWDGGETLGGCHSPRCNCPAFVHRVPAPAARPTARQVLRYLDLTLDLT